MFHIDGSDPDSAGTASLLSEIGPQSSSAVLWLHKHNTTQALHMLEGLSVCMLQMLEDLSVYMQQMLEDLSVVRRALSNADSTHSISCPRVDPASQVPLWSGARTRSGAISSHLTSLPASGVDAFGERGLSPGGFSLV